MRKMTSDEAYEVIRDSLKQQAGRYRLQARGRKYAGPQNWSARMRLRELAGECDEIAQMNPYYLGTVLRGDLG